MGRGKGILVVGAGGCGRRVVKQVRGNHRVVLQMMLQLGEWMRQRPGRCIQPRKAKQRQYVGVCLSFFDFGTKPEDKTQKKLVTSKETIKISFEEFIFQNNVLLNS